MTHRQVAVDAIKLAIEKDALLQQFEKREGLVQEVIRLYAEYALLKHPIDREAMRCTIAEAVRKLAEWKP